LLDNLSEREAATVHLIKNYGVRFTRIKSKQAFRGDEIFGNEFGFKSKFSEFKNSLLNLINKKNLGFTST
jgi:hypothetical protein